MNITDYQVFLWVLGNTITNTNILYLLIIISGIASHYLNPGEDGWKQEYMT